MKGLPFILVISLIFTSSACNNASDPLEKLNIDQKVKQVIFLSDDSDYQEEAPYYDAIVELKKQFPEEIKNMKVFKSANAKKYYDTFKVKNSPALIVIYEDKIIVKVNGKVTKEQIIQPVSKSLSSDL